MILKSDCLTDFFFLYFLEKIGIVISYELSLEMIHRKYFSVSSKKEEKYYKLSFV